MVMTDTMAAGNHRVNAALGKTARAAASRLPRDGSMMSIRPR